ncbi:hypothetical protein [Helicobacter bilis]|nr:hypothetical protein [Helicobacter bilis]
MTIFHLSFPPYNPASYAILQTTNYKLQTTNYKLHATRYTQTCRDIDKK